jgi:hypothetical protein
MVVNDDAGNQDERGALQFFAGKPAPTEKQKRAKLIYDAKTVTFDLASDLRRPVKPAFGHTKPNQNQ